MNLPCEVIRDLLPLYCDGVCSRESKSIIEDHIRRCPKCEEEFCLMGGDMELINPPITEEMIARAVKNAWEKSIKKESKNRRKKFFALIFWLWMGVCLPFMLFLASYKFGNDLDGLATLAEKHLAYEQLTIDALDKDGTSMAALCRDAEGIKHLVMYKCDPFGYDRWKPTGDEYAVSSGELSSWMYLNQRSETVLVICGVDLPEEVYGCTYQVGGVVYTCPIENNYIVDVMVIEEDEEINSLPTLLSISKG